MTKADKRKFMKALAISEFIVSENIRLRGVPGHLRLHADIAINNQAMAMNETPALLFRHDKPKLDKRRWKRYNRKQMKGAYLLTPNNLT